MNTNQLKTKHQSAENLRSANLFKDYFVVNEKVGVSYTKELLLVLLSEAKNYFTQIITLTVWVTII